MAVVTTELGNHNLARRGDGMPKDPLYRWDESFPRQMAQLSINKFNPEGALRAGSRAANLARSTRMRNRHAARFKTQPITFEEIREVDEDGSCSAAAAAGFNEVERLRDMSGLKQQLLADSKQRGCSGGGAAAGSTRTTQQSSIRHEQQDSAQPAAATSDLQTTTDRPEYAQQPMPPRNPGCGDQDARNPGQPSADGGKEEVESPWRTLLQADISQNISRSRRKRMRQRANSPPL